MERSTFMVVFLERSTFMVVVLERSTFMVDRRGLANLNSL